MKKRNGEKRPSTRMRTSTSMRTTPPGPRPADTVPGPAETVGTVEALGMAVVVAVATRAAVDADGAVDAADGAVDAVEEASVEAAVAEGTMDADAGTERARPCPGTKSFSILLLYVSPHLSPREKRPAFHLDTRHGDGFHTPRPAAVHFLNYHVVPTPI